MCFDYYCTSIAIVPDTKVGCLSQVFFLIFIAGFSFIVLMNKKYRFMTEWLIHKLSNWF